MEENKRRYDELSEYMKKIQESMQISNQRKEELDKLQQELNEETRIMMVDKEKEQIESKKLEKAEFDEMTVNAMVNAKKDILELKQDIEKEYIDKLLQMQSEEKEIESKFNRMQQRGLDKEKMDWAIQSRDKAITDLQNEKQKYQAEHENQMKNLQDWEMDIEKYAIELDVLDKIDNVRITAPASTPTTPVSTPTTPVSTPTAPASTPTTPVSTPTAPASTPTRPVSTPTAPASTPTTSSPTPNTGKLYGNLDLNGKSKDKHIRQITCEVGLGKYFVEFNDGTLETVNANVLSKKEAKSVFDVYDIDKKSNIDPNIISILLNYADKNLIGDPKKFVQEYVKEPNRDVPVVYSDKLTSKHGKIMMGKETLEDTLLVGKQDNPVKPLKRFEKRFLRQMASKQGEHKNTYLLMDERNVFKKMFDAVLSKIGKEPTFLLEETQKNEASISALNSKRMNEISENVKDKLNSIDKPEMEEENVKKYTDQKKEAWKKSLRQYKVRNVLQAPNPFSDTKKVDEEIIDNAKQGFTDRLNDPYARTKEMLDKKINEAKEENEEER